MSVSTNLKATISSDYSGISERRRSTPDLGFDGSLKGRSPHFSNCGSLVLLFLLAFFCNISSAQAPTSWVIFQGTTSDGTRGTWYGKETTWEAAAQDVLDVAQICLGRGDVQCGPLILVDCGPGEGPASPMTWPQSPNYGGCGVYSPLYPESPTQFGIALFAQQFPPAFSVQAQPPVKSAIRACPCVGDPINPALGIVYKTDTDIPATPGRPITFERFYDSADANGIDMGPAWRHSYSRSIVTNYSASNPVGFAGQSALVSAEYPDPATACTSGFSDIQPAVSAWAGASTTYTGNTCVISRSGRSIGTLLINSSSVNPASSSVTEYDVIRDDGQTLRYTMQGGVINNPPGISLRLVLTGSGFTLTDDQDTVETYNAAGVLQSIASRTGIVQTLTYGTNGLLSAVVDNFGNSLSISRNASNQIASVSLNGSSAIQYGYSLNSQLISITYGDSTTRQFLYGGSEASALTGEIDEGGGTYATWGYDSQHRATSSSLAGGVNAVSLVYNGADSVTVTNALGAARTLSFTRSGDLKPVNGISGSPCLECGDTLATTYDDAGWLSSRTDFNGNVTCYANDPTRGLELVRVEGFAPGSACPSALASYTPASGTLQRAITTTWSPTWREPALITEPNRTTAFTFDGSGNVLTKTVTDTTVSPNVSRIWTYTYNGYGQVFTTKGPRTDVNSTTTYTYYSCSSGTQCGQVQTLTNALGQVTTFNSYNAYGQPLTITDPNGVVTTLTYDARERIISSQVGTETTGYSYYPTGLLNVVTLPDSSTLQYTYDGAHRLTAIADGAGNSIRYTLDALGNHTADNSYDPSGVLHLTHTRVFNTLSELNQDIKAAGGSAVTTTFGYDSEGNQTSIAAPLSRNTTQTFDALNRLSQITDPASGVTQLGYDANDHLISVTDPRALQTTYTRNGFGNVTQQASPDTGTTTTTYDSGGNLKTATDARGALATYSYDALNRVTQAAYSDQTINFSYDAGANGVGRLTGASDANHSLTWLYDTHGRVIGKGMAVGSVALSVGYGYSNGDLASIVSPSGQTITYSYTDHQVTSVSVNGTALVTGATYEPFGAVNGWTWGNFTTVSRSYDGDEKITQISTAGDTNNFGYDNAFRITGITDTGISANSWTLGYDALDRLTSAAQTATTLGWSYDANGNRLNQTGSNASTFTPSSTSNQLNSIAGALTRTYSYDAAGNTTSYSSDSFTYNQRGRMSSAATGTTSATYVYSALGQLIEKTVGSTTTLLMYDESGHVLGEYSSSGALIQETVWMGNIPVATLRPNGSTGCTSTICAFYVHTDQLNAPRKITRPSDNGLMWRWDTDPFGTAAPNQNPAGLGTFVYDLRFPGQIYMAETGLNQNYFRDYDPQTPRFLESDPIGIHGGLNTYAYALNDPLGFIDPYGLQRTTVDAAIEQAIRQGNIGELETLLEAANPEQAALLRNALQRLTSKAEQIIAKECRGSINREFPTQLRDNTLKEIMDAAKGGDSTARKALKLLNDSRFKK
jgi:RHS repeat-associated protein